MTEADDFSPEDVFKLFPTAFPMRPRPERPEVETTGAPNTTLATTVDPGADFLFGLNGTWIFGEAEDTIILPLLLAVIGICSLIGNGLVVFVVVAVRRMRTGPNLMLLNIAVSDLVFMALCVPTAILNHATPGGATAPPAGPGLCKFVHYMIFVTVYVSIYSLVVACVFRFFGDYMTGSRQQQQHEGATVGNPLLSRANAAISSAVIWLAFFVSHLKFLIRPEGAVFQESFICLYSFVLPESAKIRTLWVTFLTCAFLLPLVTICSLSAVVLHRQRRWRHRALTAADRTPLPPLLQPPPPRSGLQAAPPRAQHHPEHHAQLASGHHHHRQHHHHPAHARLQQYEAAQNEINERRNRREITVVLMASMVTRALFWLPIQIFIMIDVFGMAEITDVYRKAEMVGVCCAFAGTCTSPLLYNCLSIDFKAAFSETFRKLGCACATERADETISDMNETIMSIISDSSNHINYT